MIPLTRLRVWLNDSPTRRWTASLLGATMLIVGGTLIVTALVPPTPPDPAVATGDQIAHFLANGYDRIGSEKREAFTRGLADRFLDMDRDQRREFRQQWRDSRHDREVQRRVGAEMHLAMMRGLAERYDQTPPEVRSVFLDRLLVMIDMMGPGADKYMDWLDSNPMDAIIRDPHHLHRDLEPLQRDLIIGTSARERAALVQLGGDLLKRARHHGRR